MTSLARLAVTGFLAVMGVADVDARAGVTDQSPFLPTAATATGEPGNIATTYKFAGVIASENTCVVGIVDTRNMSSVWIPVGQKVGEIEAVSYDRKTEQAIIKVGEVYLTLALNSQPVASPASNSATPTNQTAPANPPRPSNASAERESRALVSDLLDISTQNRKSAKDSPAKSSKEPAAPQTPDHKQ